MGTIGEIEAVAVGPMLVHAAPWVSPIVVDLAAKHVPADAPHVLVGPESFKVVVTHADVVDIGNLERKMIQSGLLMPQAEEDMVIDIGVAAIAAIERSNQIVLAFDVDVVRTDHSQHFAEPIDGFAKPRRHQHTMPNALDVGGPSRQPHELAGARGRRLPGVELLPLDGNWADRGNAGDDL